MRPVLTEIALFLAPFAAYAVFLWARREGVLDPASWPLPRLMWLTIAAFVLLLGSFLVIAQFSHSPPGSSYVPAHVEGGKLVPGEAK
jgi:heme/copper-type cytochrome/quinol oxidase subunit 3